MISELSERIWGRLGLSTETRELLALEPSFRTWKSEAGSAALV